MRAAFARAVVVCLLVVTASVAAVPVSGSSGSPSANGTADAASSDEFDLEVRSAVSTPERTVEVEGDQYTVDGIGVVQPGDPIEMTVTSSENYWVYLYNTDGQAEHSDTWSDSDERIAMGTSDDDLDTAALEPGTYMLALNPQGEGRQAVYPVVIEAVDLSLDYPRSVAADETVTLEATVTGDASPVRSVDVAVWDETTEDAEEVSLTADGDGTYSATLNLEGYDEGDYHIYGAAFGDDEAEGYPAPIAVDNGATMTVTADDDGDGSDGSDDSDDEEGSDDGEEENDEERADGENDSDDADEREAGDDDDGSTDERNESDGDDETEVLSPSDSTETDDTDDDALGTSVAVPLTVLTLLAALVIGGLGRSNER